MPGGLLKEVEGATIFVKNLSKNVGKEQLTEHFEQVDFVISVNRSLSLTFRSLLLLSMLSL